MNKFFLYSEQYDFQTYVGKLKKIIVVLFMPRSGSTLLGCLLSQTKKLGFPLEYFSEANFEYLSKRLNGLSITNILPLLNVRTSPNGVFGYKWNYDFEENVNHRELGNQLYPDYILMVDRKNKDQQARSLCIARKTGCWVLEKDNVRKSHEDRITIDEKEIEQVKMELERSRLKLDKLAEKYDAEVLRIYYEDIIANENKIVKEIGVFCNEKISACVSIYKVPIQKQSVEDKYGTVITQPHNIGTIESSLRKGNSKIYFEHKKMINSSKTINYYDSDNMKLKLLLATNHLFTFTGSELTIYTLAKELALKGHFVCIFAKYISNSFAEIFKPFAIVTDDLKRFEKIRFDAAYVQHGPIALEVRYHYPKLPLFFASLGIIPFLEQPPPFELSVAKYLAISEEVRDNLIKRNINSENIVLYRNIVDAKQFKSIRALNDVPKIAAIYSYKIDVETKNLILKTCKKVGITCDHIGTKPGEIKQEKLCGILNKYDIVFTLGRGVIETMMCEKIPIVLDVHGGDGMVTPNNLVELMQNNFSGRRYKKKYTVNDLLNEIKRYDATTGIILRNLAVKYFDSRLGVTNLIQIMKNELSNDKEKISKKNKNRINYILQLMHETKGFVNSTNMIKDAKNKLEKNAIEDSRGDSIAPSLIEVECSNAQSKGPDYGVVRLIAFFLPQFHRIFENDMWWGKGFTEWTNVTKAKPLFPGHYQPHLPADLGFYDLRLPETRIEQAQLAQKYGIYGFCYYHYWFHGKKILERPIEDILTYRQPDFPFCLCWANEHWTRAWDGGNTQILLEQHYSHKDDLEHIRYLLPFFKDQRYIRVNGKPLFLVYRANQLPDPLRTTELWREIALKSGIGEIYLCRVESFSDEHSDPTNFGFDAAVEFQPDWKNLNPQSVKKTNNNLKVHLYSDIIEEALNKRTPKYKRFPCVFPSWDNTPRRGKEGLVFSESSPEKYEWWLTKTIEKFNCPSKDENLIFINAWNEWAEGAHLEPDQKYERGYLEATKRVIDNVKEKKVNEASKNIEQKKVSIIIPVYNQLEYTKRCVNAIIQNTDYERYEIIIVNNNSTDGHEKYFRTQNRLLTVINNSENRGFVRACNQGASAAKGDYYLFLNNDTEPQPGWLKALLKTAENNEKAGAVGAKLIYPDGRLQEAGALIFSDGSGYNFGRGADPREHAFNVSCEVDYCSGACLLVRREIFEKLGGFDERYSPGYYEETDLCFGIRSLGFKVFYEPKAVVIHHGSVTANSMDANFSNYLIEKNRRKFVEKWKKDLELQDPPPKISGKLPYTASRERLERRPTLLRIEKKKTKDKIVVFFPHNPMPPKTGAHLRCLSILNALSGMKMDVLLVSSAVLSDQPWTSNAVQRLSTQLGISAAVHFPSVTEKKLIREHYTACKRNDIEKHRIPGLGHFFTKICQLNDPDFVLINYAYWGYLVERLAKCDLMKVIEMHDLLSLNDRMQKKIWKAIGRPPFGPGDFRKLKWLQTKIEQEHAEIAEIEVYDQFDLVLAINRNEANYIRHHLRRAAVETLPMAFSPIQMENTYKGAPLFVISSNVFNFQGYLYFIDEVLPKVRQIFPGLEVNVIGDACRYLKGSNGVRLLGYQESLKEYYSQAPFAICPLLAGTGQQVKIVEAMAHGVPVIAMRQVSKSSPIVHGENGLIADNADEFTNFMKRCLERPDLCRRLGENARRTIAENFSQDKLQQRLEVLLRKRGSLPTKASATVPKKSDSVFACGSQPQHILWVRPDAIGDNVLSSGMLKALKEKYPDSKITVLCQSTLVELYESCPHVNQVIGFEKERALADAAYRKKVGERLEAIRADLTLNSVYSREPLGDYFADASSASQTVGYEGDLCNITAEERERNNRKYTRLIASNRNNALEIERHCDFLRGIGITDFKLEPALWLKKKDEEFAEQIFDTNRLDPQHTIAIFAGSKLNPRSYSRIGIAIKEACLGTKMRAIALGKAEDAAFNRLCLSQMGEPALDLSGKTSLRQAAAVLKRCRLAVGIDTGLAHMACAVGTPQVVVVGGGHFGRFWPYSTLTTIACLPLDCYGCNWRCPLPAARCVRDLDPLVVARAVEAAMSSDSQRPRIFWQANGGLRLDGCVPRSWPASIKVPENVELVRVETGRGGARYHGASKTAAKVAARRSSAGATGIGSETEQERRALAQALLKTDSVELEQLYTGQLGEHFRRLAIESRSQQGNFAENPMGGGPGEEGSRAEGDGARKLQLLMADMLYQSPYRMPSVPRLAEVPVWFREDYLRFLLTAPRFFELPGEAKRFHRHIEAVATDLSDELDSRPGNTQWLRLADVFASSAALAQLYFSREDVGPVFSKRAKILEYLLVDKLGPSFLKGGAVVHRGDRIRLGVYLPAIGNEPETYASLPVLLHLDRRCFEVCCYVHRETGNPLEELVREKTAAFTVLPKGLRPSANAIRNDGLDILFFGTNLTANQGYGCLLACLRLARKQVVHFANPVSPRLPNVDAFLLGELAGAGRPAADGGFGEVVVGLPGSGIAFQLPPPGGGEQGGFPESRLPGMARGKTVFASGANCFKIIPELQHLWAGILKAVPGSVLVLYPFGPAWGRHYPEQAFRDSFHRVLAERGVAADRLIVLGTMRSRAEVLALLREADVYLDAVPYSGATSLLDPLAVGLPLVVCEGDQLRFRQGAAMLRELGIGELVAESERSYEALAVALGRDAELRARWRRKIQERMAAGPAFLDAEGYAARLGAAFERLLADENKRLRMAG